MPQYRRSDAILGIPDLGLAEERDLRKPLVELALDDLGPRLFGLALFLEIARPIPVRRGPGVDPPGDLEGVVIEVRALEREPAVEQEEVAEERKNPFEVLKDFKPQK